MKRLVFLSLALLLAFHTVGQSSYPDVPHPEFFKTIPPIDANTPDWAVMMYGDDPNMFEVTTAFIKYYEEHEYVKTVHGQNYKFWIKTAGEYVNEEGFIRLPTREQEEALYKKLKKRKGETATKSSANWTSIGPFETYHGGSLEPTSNQVNVYSLDQSESNSDVLFAGSESGAIFKSTDHGLNWSPTSYGEAFSGGFGGIEIHPTDPDHVLVGVNNRIYLTTDGGTTWTERAVINGNGYEIKYRPSNPDSVFCSASNGLYLSTDAGLTWSAAIFPNETCYDLDWHTTHPDTVFLLKKNDALARAELFVSGDGGISWTLKDNGYYSPNPDSAGVSGGKIALTAAAPSRVYVCLIGSEKKNDNGWLGVVRSDDGGENWTVPVGQYGGPYQSINTDPWNVAAYGSGYHQGFYNFDCEASPTDPDLIWIGTIRLSESTDGGATFTAIGAANSQRLGNVHADIQDIEVNGDEVWVANDGGIEYSNDKLQSSASRKRGIAGSNFWGFGTGWNKDVFTGGLYHNGNATYYQEYGVGNSIKLGGVEEATGYINPLNNQTAYFNQYWSGGTAVRSVPDALGDSYTTQHYMPLIPNEHYWTNYSSGLYFDPRYANHMYMGRDSSVWKSTDAGYNWNKLVELGPGGRTLELAISRKNPDYIYAIFIPDDGGFWDWREMYLSTDGGTSWNQLTDVPTNSRAKLEMTLNPDDENEIWVAAYHGSNGNKVYKSLDGGTTWINRTSAALDGENIVDIFYQGGTDSLVYVLTNNGAFYYDAAMSDWVDFSIGLPLRPRSFRIEPFFRDSKLRMATGGHAIWKTPLAGASLPVSQPITWTDSLFCSRDTVEFDCYSILDHDGAGWEWSFSPAPLFVSDANARNPKVVFGQSGSFDVTLKVTDGSGNMDSKMIADMIIIESSCEADTIAGQLLVTTGASNSNVMVEEAPAFGAATDFSVSVWFKTTSTISDGVIVGNKDWDSGGNKGWVFAITNGKIWWNVGDGTNRIDHKPSAPIINDDEWHHFAATCDRDGLSTVYMDGVFIDTISMTAIGEITNTKKLSFGADDENDYRIAADIDESCIYDRALTQEEVRELAHLTRTGAGVTTGLVAYHQFNELINGELIMDKAGSYHGTLNEAAVLQKSNAPVGAGVSQLVDLAEGLYEYDFPNAGAKLWLSDCDEMQGQVVVSRLNVLPDTLPNANPAPNNYWIISRYDDSGIYSSLDSLELTPDDNTWISQLTAAEEAVLHLRSENGDSATWEAKTKAIGLTSGTFRFNRNSTIIGSTQIALTKGADPFVETDPGRPCEVDTLALKGLHTVANGDYFISQNANLTNLTHFTVTGWWKPNGVQQPYAALFSSGDWCAHCDDTEGLIYNYHGGRLWYKWPGMADNWAGHSGMYVPSDEWSYVALVIEPTQATMYLNDQKYVHTKALNPGEIQNIHIGYGHYSKSFIGDIDEVTMWERALTEAEIRSMRHLTKEDEIENDPDLIGYWQFNELVYDDLIIDRAEFYHGTLNAGATLEKSTAPIGGGASQTMDLGNGQYEYDFADVGTKIYMSDCEEPNGQMVISRLNVAPDTLPNTNPAPDNYWIINHYDGTGSFPPLDSLALTSNDDGWLTQVANTKDGILHLRSENGDSATWGVKTKAIDLIGDTLLFNRNANITGSTQIAMTNGAGYFDETDLGKICEVDTIPGNALYLPGGSGNYAIVPQLDLNTNTFTASVWIKPNGLQNDNAGIVFSRGGTTTSGIHIKNNNEVRYHWDGGKWGWSSGAVAPADEWSHVALVIEPAQATIYLNGIPYVNTSSHAVEAFDNSIRIGNDANSGSRTYNGLLDEVCIWDRALSQNEVRELMHLTKEGLIGTDPNLKVYLQFNEPSGKIYDKSGGQNHATLNSGNVTREVSTAPFGGGESSRIDVTTGGVYPFGNTGVTMGFNPSATTYPDGELLVSRINVAPDSLTPTTNASANGVYWVVSNYGTNPTFDMLDSLVLENVPGIYAANESMPDNFHIYKRSSNAFGNTWGSPLDTADAMAVNAYGTGRLVFSNANNISSFSQFVLGDDRGVEVDIKALLEGPHTAGAMSDNLRTAILLPQKEPYSDLNFTHISGGDETCSATVFAPSGNDAIVDWLMVELRDKNNPTQVLFTRSALLRADGAVVEMDGVSPLKFNFAAADDYYVAIRHRNHLGAMTAAPIMLSETPTVLDFSNGSVPTFGGMALKDLSGGYFGLPAADINNDGLVDAADRHLAWNERTATDYRSTDVNMDGQVDEADRALVWLNRNMIQQLP